MTSPSPIPLRRKLLTPIVGAVLLLLVFAAIVLWLMWRFQSEQVQLRHSETVRTMAALIARDMEVTTRHLAHMGTSPLITERTMSVFADRCREVLKFRSDWANMVLIDRSGRQLINTLFATGVALPGNALQQHHLRAFETAKPQVSGVFQGAATGRWTVSVSVPVVVDGTVAYVLSVALSPDLYDRMLADRVTSGGGAAALLDRDYRYIARSTDGARMRGQAVSADVASALRKAPGGTGRFPAADDDHVVTSWQPVPGTEWTVAVGLPEGVAYGRLGAYLLVLAGSALLILGGAALVALRRSQHIGAAVTAAGDYAFQAAEGTTAPIPISNIVEIDRMNDALSRSAATIRAAHQENRRLLAQEQDARLAAETANKAKDELLAMLGHELRNPLAAIITSVHLLNRPEQSPDKLDFAHRIITRQSLHLSRLVDDLLDVGRVITGKMQLKKLPVDLSDAVTSVVEALRTTGDANDHKIVLDTAPVFVDADFTRMHQVMMNLLTNALKYTDEGGTIQVSVRREGTDAVVAVRDTGSGMTVEELGRVFDVFYQGKVAHKGSSGLGLGLLLVRRIVEQHGGTVSAESPGPGKGSLFTLRLPAIEYSDPSVDAGHERIPAQYSCSVLLIEDNEDMRQALRAGLEEDGHRVIEAEDGLSGLAAALSVKPHVAIVDIGLPGMSGYHVCEAIRAKTGSDIFLIALTGHGQPDDIRRAAQAGFDIHMVKPPDMQRLARLLASLGRCDSAPREAGSHGARR